MTESQMVIWNVKKLQKEFNLGVRVIHKILRDIGAKRWTGNAGMNSCKYYWDEEDGD